MYDFPIINKTVYEKVLSDFNKPKGCLELIKECRELGDLYDPSEFAINATVNKVCQAATLTCTEYAVPYSPPFSMPEVGIRSPFDMAHVEPDPYPRSFPAGFFNQEWVQKDLGVPVNFTANSNLLSTYIAFAAGDPYRRAGMKDVEYLLEQGVKIALIYGDRDYTCPWYVFSVNFVERSSLAPDLEHLSIVKLEGALEVASGCSIFVSHQEMKHLLTSLRNA